MPASAPDPETERAFARVKIQVAALLVGMPFYVLVVVLFLTGPGQAAALGLYGLAAAAWIVWQTRRAVRGLSEAR
ncbi:hypothetical protein AN478_00760 [Thiohalorhabdus denitrificans]|uniref:Uncharacterized protein n=1 Tax=Thiohalorhabdus denitrificans TaxID=381306 RepID=A0A0P9CXP8_9GAMM|nr:hypothetical protein [Thiohalorhabdus denitrificans]KPV41648.1 hypothetical protein AN478_00760 [Thiohalorhabdus denitrificans]SCY56526.1 hypothetical protein SAMN05661077_2519 [Thiohalorhabdus denitrificans]